MRTMAEQGLLLVISGPSGCGKDTIIHEVLHHLDGDGFLSVSMTTRPKRGEEVHGLHYYFVSETEFLQNVQNDQMLEYAQYGENYYGTPVGPIRELLAQGKTVILNIEVTGGKNVRRLLPFAVEVFVAPPSLQELRRRLEKRGTETPQAIETRMKIATRELACAKDYDYIVINDVLEDAVQDVLAIIRTSKLKKENMLNKLSEVTDYAES